MTFEEAVSAAQSGLRVSHSEKPAWIEYDGAAHCLTLNNGQPHRVRWVPAADDVAASWYVVPTPEQRAAEVRRDQLTELIRQVMREEKGRS